MPANPMMMPHGPEGQQAWAIVNELKNDFNIRHLTNGRGPRSDDDIKVLLLIHPREISDKTQ